jgi:hypothetical protein
MSFQDYYVRECKWCSQRLVIGLCNDDAWRAYEIPSKEQSGWTIHQCHQRSATRTATEEMTRRFLLDF